MSWPPPFLLFNVPNCCSFSSSFLYLLAENAAWFDEENASQNQNVNKDTSVSGHVDMYSAERQESMRQQFAQLHHREEEKKALSSEVSQECQEWQNIARREKHVEHSSFAQSSSQLTSAQSSTATQSSTAAHFSSVRTIHKHTQWAICK
jgi:hypothetical protein